LGLPTVIARSDITFIELYDWESGYRESPRHLGSSKDLTPPIRIVFAGSASQGQIDLEAGDAIDCLIMPPHHICDRDFQDVGTIDNERVLGYSNGRLDRSWSQVEAIVVLSLSVRPSVRALVHNHYTNILAGDMRLAFYHGLSGKKIWSSRSSVQAQQQWHLKIQRSKLVR
jgi:hypothetical protein